MKTDDYISASEIGEYLYCRRAWWYRRQQGIPAEPTPAMDAGTAQHTELARTVEQTEQRGRMAWGLLLVGVIVLVIMLLLRASGGG